MPLFNRVNSGGILLSYKCTNECRHCLYSCSPKYEESMAPDDIDILFKNISVFGGSLKGFHIAGGEPSLKPELVFHSLYTAKKYNIPIEYLESNGWFARNINEAEKFVKKLYLNGLKCVMISISPFHSEFISLKTTMDAIKIIENIMGKGSAFLWKPDFYLDIASISEIEKIPLEVYLENHMIEEIAEKYSLILGGRAAVEIAPKLSLSKAETFFGQNCFIELFKTGHAHFDPYYNYIPTFCSGISMGDWRELEKILNEFDIERYPLVKMLSQDIKLLFDFAVSNGFTPSSEGYASKCHLCMNIRLFLYGKGDFPELAPESFYKSLIYKQLKNF